MPEPTCPMCGGRSDPSTLAEAAWLPADVVARLAEEHPGWRREVGGCPACLQDALLTVLLRQGENVFHAGVQSVWPLDPEAAFGAIPTPLRLHADPRFTGRGVTIAFVDAGFFPHPDLVAPANRICAWADASGPYVRRREFGPGDLPRWPRWDARDPGQWHGLMTTTTACGNGSLSHGFYRGLAPDARLVLVQVADGSGHIGDNASGGAVVGRSPWLKPPLVSSSAYAGACTTPSRLIHSKMILSGDRRRFLGDEIRPRSTGAH